MEQAPQIQHDSEDDNISEPDLDIPPQNGPNNNSANPPIGTINGASNKENKAKVGIQLHFAEHQSNSALSKNKPLSVQTNFDANSECNMDSQQQGNF